MGLSKILDKIGDALVPKEIAPFLGPAAMAFAGPLGPFASMAIGQLGSMKMLVFSIELELISLVSNPKGRNQAPSIRIRGRSNF